MKKKIKQKVKFLLIGITLSVFSAGLFTGYSVAAANSCAGVDTSIIHCDEQGGGEIQDSGVWALLLLAINILTAGVGVVALGGIIYAAILYTSAGGNTEQVKKAMTIITDIVIGVLAYALMYAVLNFLIPGGIFA